MRPRILFLVHADLDALRRKGVADDILARDQAGFFSRVITIHPLASVTQSVELDAAHVVHEYGTAPSIWRGGMSWTELAALPLRAVRVTLAATRLARKERIDIVQATDPYLCGLIGWWVSRRVRVPFCVSIHADYSTQFRLTPRRGAARASRVLAGAVRWFVLDRAARVLPISAFLAAGLVRDGVRAERICVLPHGIDVEREPNARGVRARFAIPETDRLVVFAGRLSRGKYAGDVLEAVARVRDRGEPVTLLVLGGGEEERRLREAAAARASLRERVHFAGFQPRDTVRDAFAAADAVLCPLGGFTLIEACAAAAPVIAYDIEWHTELVEHGVTGMVVPAGDAAAMGDALAHLLMHPAKARILGEAARTRARTVHDIRLTREVKRRCYEDLLAPETVR